MDEEGLAALRVVRRALRRDAARRPAVVRARGRAAPHARARRGRGRGHGVPAPLPRERVRGRHALLPHGHPPPEVRGGAHRTRRAAPVLESGDRLVKEQFPAPDGSKQLVRVRAPRLARDRPRPPRARRPRGRHRGLPRGGRQRRGRPRGARLPDRGPPRAAGDASPRRSRARATFPVQYRNVGEIRFKAYPVDLQVLFAVRRTLEGLNRIDLSGIAPALEWSLTPKDGKDHAWHETAGRAARGQGRGRGVPRGRQGRRPRDQHRRAQDRPARSCSSASARRSASTSPTPPARASAAPTSPSPTATAIKARGQTDGRGLFEAPGVGAKPFVVVSLDDRYAIAR